MLETRGRTEPVKVSTAQAVEMARVIGAGAGCVKIGDDSRKKGSVVPNATLQDLQDRVGAVSDIYAERFEINRDEVWHLAKLNEELGELVQAYLKSTGRGRAKDQAPEQLREDVENEVADLFAQVLLFAAWQEIDVARALERKWFKYL